MCKLIGPSSSTYPGSLQLMGKLMAAEILSEKHFWPFNDSVLARISELEQVTLELLQEARIQCSAHKSSAFSQAGLYQGKIVSDNGVFLVNAKGWDSVTSGTREQWSVNQWRKCS